MIQEALRPYERLTLHPYLSGFCGVSLPSVLLKCYQKHAGSTEAGMATITKLQRKKGAVYRAQVRIKRDGKIIHSEAKTFSRKALADAWASKRELELESPEALARAKHGGVTVAYILDKYREDAPGGRTKRSHLVMLASLPLSEKDALRLTVGQLIEHAEARSATAGPATLMNDFIWLRVAFKYARRTWNIPVDVQVIEDATASLRERRMVGKSKSRERRVSDDEVKRIIAHLEEHKDTGIPMGDIIRFALHSSRREGEITRLLWADMDEAARTGWVRDVKHPTRKIGNHKRCKFTKEAWAIIERQPKTDARIFPYNPKTISAYFTQTVAMLEIPDLRFHDLRHEATSRLFERGHSIQEVQQFTLHEDWKTLARYTHLRPEDVPDR
jgi:integrase